MQITRKFEIFATTRRRYVIHQPPLANDISCAECGEQMLTTEQAAVLFGIKQRRIFQTIETGAAHLAETDMGVMMICRTSLATLLSDEGALNTDR